MSNNNFIVNNDYWWVNQLGLQKVKFIEYFNDNYVKVLNNETQEQHFVLKQNLFSNYKEANEKFAFGK